jgi:hypothetical protein
MDGPFLFEQANAQLKKKNIFFRVACSELKTEVLANMFWLIYFRNHKIRKLEIAILFADIDMDYHQPFTSLTKPLKIVEIFLETFSLRGI